MLPIKHAVFLCLLLLMASVTSNAPLDASRKIGDFMVGGLFGLRNVDTEDHCGEVYPMGVGFAEAMSFAIERVNKDQRLLRGITLGYDIRDYCESALLAMKSTYEFVKRTDAECAANYTLKQNSRSQDFIPSDSRPLIAVIGPIDSASAIVVASLLKVPDIPIVTPTATSDELSSRLYRHVFRTIPPDKWQASVMADLIEQFKWTYVATIAVDDPYGRNGVWALERESYTRQTFCIAVEEFIPRMRYQTKLKAILHKLQRQANVKVIILWLFGNFAVDVFEGALEHQLSNRTWILSEATAANEGFLSTKYVDILDGSLGIQPRFYHDLGLEHHYENLTFDESYLNGGSWWKELWKSEFNCTDYLSCAGRNIALTKEIIQTFYSPYTAYVIDAVSAIAHALDKIYRCPTAKVSRNDSCSTVQLNETRESFFQSLKNVRFKGLSGTIQFDEFGDPTRASYDIVNFHQVSKYTNDNVRRLAKSLVGLWNKTAQPRLLLNGSAIQWNPHLGRTTVPLSVCARKCMPGTRKIIVSPCCWKCAKCPLGTVTSSTDSLNCTACGERQRANDQRTQCDDLQHNNLHWNSITGTIVITTTMCGFILTLLSLAVFIKYFNSPIVKASNRELSFLLLTAVGTFLLLALLNLLTPTPTLCRVTQCLRYTTYTVCVTALLLKTMRILSAFRVNVVTEQFKQCILKVKRQSLLTLPFLGIQSLLVVAWFLLDPPHYMDTVSPGHYVYSTCRPYSAKIGQTLVGSICCYILFLSLLCTYYSFKARNIPDNFNEAKCVSFSMYILLLSAAAYYPAEFALVGYYVNVVACISLVVTALGLLGCLFGPKVYIILRHPEKNTESFLSGQIAQFTFGPSVLHSEKRSRVSPYVPEP